jgi:hypothetical protein
MLLVLEEQVVPQSLLVCARELDLDPSAAVPI